MAYLTLQDAKDYLGEVYDNAYYNETTEIVDDTELTADIDEMEGIVDAYVSRAYTTAITGAKSLAILKGITQRLLLHKAHTRMDYSNLPQGVIDGQMDSMYRLKDISTGKMLLPDETQSPKANVFQAVYGGQTASNQPVFKRSSMRWF